MRDVLSVLARRFPLIDVDILPVPVQGETAAAQITAMLQRAVASGRHDVILLARGGGSLEDLWAFNDEGLARAIADSPVPVVSAVGHETDFSLSDFAADLRAPTPSAAAELLVPSRVDLGQRLAGLHRRASALQANHLRQLAQRTDRAALRLNSQRPQARLQAYARAATKHYAGCNRPGSNGCRRMPQACAMPVRCCRRRARNAVCSCCASSCPTHSHACRPRLRGGCSATPCSCADWPVRWRR